MAGRYLSWMAGGLFVMALLICSGDAAPELGKQAGVNQKMIAAAREALKATEAIVEVDRASYEDVYRWSRRVVEAEDFSPEAIKDHITLMRELHARVAARAKRGLENGDPRILHATEYYLAEAEGFGPQ